MILLIINADGKDIRHHYHVKS